MFKKLGAAVVAALLLTGSAFGFSQNTDPTAIIKMQDRVGQPPVIMVQNAVPAPLVVPSDSVVTPDGKGGVVVSVGSALGGIWSWAILAFGGIIVAIILSYVRKGMAKMGVQMTADQEAELSRALQDGFNHAATTGEQLVAGKLPIEVSDPTAAAAIKFTLSQKGALLQSMGLDPTDGNTVKMLQAKLATLKVDPATPTAVETQIITTKPDGLTAADKSKIV